MANPLLDPAAKPKPMSQPPFNIADIYAQLGLPMNGADTDYWSGRQQQGVSQQNVQTSLPAVNAEYQQILGRNMQPGAMPHLDPILQSQGTQGVRQNLAGSEEYQNRMFGPSQSEWQTAARQGTMNQSMMPGSFWDYTNPLLTNPETARGLMQGGPSNDGMQKIITNLMAVLGLADPAQKPDEKKQSPRRGTPNPEGETFFERVRGY